MRLSPGARLGSSLTVDYGGRMMRPRRTRVRGACRLLLSGPRANGGGTDQCVRCRSLEGDEEAGQSEAAPKLPEISRNTTVSLEHYLKVAKEQDDDALSRRLTISQRSAHIKAARKAKRAALSVMRKAQSLAQTSSLQALRSLFCAPS